MYLILKLNDAIIIINLLDSRFKVIIVFSTYITWPAEIGEESDLVPEIINLYQIFQELFSKVSEIFNIFSFEE